MGTFKRADGSTGFLKANGAVDNNSYMLSSSNKINIADTRSAAVAPTGFSDKMLSVTFTNQDGGNGSDWASIITVKGWTNSYNVWQLAGGSGTSLVESLKFRAGVSSWGSWKTIAFTDSTVAVANKLGTATVGSATLPVYINAGTATACTASSIFSALAMSGNNLSITVAGQNRTLAIGYATNAGTATNATNATNVIVNYHNVNDTNYPMIWSNQVNTSTVTANQLYKSSDFHYNPANGRLSAKVFRENGTDLASKYAAASHTHSYAAVSHTHSEYLPIAGGTATGTITAPKFVVTNGPLWRTINGYNCPVPTLVYRGRWATGDTSIRIAYQDPFSLHSGFTYSSSTGKLTLTHTIFKTKVGVGFDSTNLMIHVWPYGSKRYALTYDRAETKFSVDSRSGGDNANTEFILEIFIIT